MLYGQTSTSQTTLDATIVSLHPNLIIQKKKCQLFMRSPQANLVKIMILIH
jgi:hypothetical protein